VLLRYGLTRLLIVPPLSAEAERRRQVDLIARAYSSIAAKDCSRMLGVPNEQLTACTAKILFALHTISHLAIFGYRFILIELSSVLLGSRHQARLAARQR